MRGKKLLVKWDSFVVTVSRYAPGERHGLHTDTYSRISFFLAGGCNEESRRSVIRMSPGHVLLKSRRVLHEDQFWKSGAVIAALEFTNEDPFDAMEAADLWRSRADGFALRCAMVLLEAAFVGDPHTVSAAGLDLLASTNENSSCRPGPQWLKQLRDELDSAPLASVDVAARARNAGAHPAHASRLFRRCYGVSITEHAQAQSVRRALAPLANGAPLSEAAQVAGFYDQSHMTRVFKRVTGRTPGGYRAMLAAAAC
jgi:AraC family transcriptional regulator